MVHMATKVERQQKKKSNRSQPILVHPHGNQVREKMRRSLLKQKQNHLKEGKWLAKWDVNLKFMLILVLLNAFDVWE